MTVEEKPPLSPVPSTTYPGTPSRVATSSSFAKTDIDSELGVDHAHAHDSAPRPSWLGRFRMAYSRKMSLRPSPPPSTPVSLPHGPPIPSLPYHGFSEYPEGSAGAGGGPSKRVRLQIDTDVPPDSYAQRASAAQPFTSVALTPHAHARRPSTPRSTIPPPSQSGVSSDETAVDTEPYREPSMLILLREDYFSIKHFWRTANRKDILRKLTARHMWKWYLIITVAAVFSALLAINHDRVVHWCHPIARKIRHWPAGFMIPIVILVILSYPPLVGHEIIGILVGLVWDLGKGFAILAAGTFIGECALWVSFKWCCQARAAKFEKSNKLYSSLTALIREKTFVFVLILRFSAVPGHITTAVSASAGANFWLYALAAFLTLPKQFAIVYLGSAFGTKSTKNTLISTAVMVITILGTLIAAGYVYYQIRLVMRRRAVLIPVAAVPLGDQPTWADVANAEVIARRQSHLAGHLQKVVIVSPDGQVTSPIAHSHDPRLARIRDQDRVFPERGGNRRNAPTRAWSVPHKMSNEEYDNYIATANKDLSPRLEASSTVVDGEVVPDLLKWDSFRVNGNSNSTGPGPFSAGPRLIRYDSSMTLLGSGSPPRHTEVFGDPLYPPPPTSPSLGPDRERPYSRGTVSLDLERSVSNPFRSGGRQIADDADLYAYARGGRRPDFGNLRSESRGPLLGRKGRDVSFTASDDARSIDIDVVQSHK